MPAFEIGAGTGTATRRLLRLGADPLVAIEPDERFATFLRNAIPDPALTVMTATFEETQLQPASFDLAVSATAFHWVDEDIALPKVASLLRPGARWAMFWNVFGDPDRSDPFHEATRELLGEPLRPSAGKNEVPFALDAEARLAALKRTSAFDNIEHRTSSWTLLLDAEQTVALYATYSNVNIRSDREKVLQQLRRIAQGNFRGRVTRNIVTSLYVARRVP